MALPSVHSDRTARHERAGVAKDVRRKPVRGDGGLSRIAACEPRGEIAGIEAVAGGRGVDLAIDIGGASTLQQSITAAAAGAAVSIVGLVGGLTAQIDLADVFQKNLRLDGIETGSRAMLEEMIAWFETRKLIPVIDSCYSFNDSKNAFIHLRDGGHIGKICLSV